MLVRKLLVSFFILTVLTHSSIGGKRKKQWAGTLVFQDDFPGYDVNKSNWRLVSNCDSKGPRHYNLECYTDQDDNLSVRNGSLFIKTKAELWPVSQLFTTFKNFTSGKVISTGGKPFSYGTFIVRARLARGKHLLPTIALTHAYPDSNFCKYEEISIVEGTDTDSTVVFAADFGRQWDSVKRHEKLQHVRRGQFSEKFHEFAVMWRPHKIEWFIDDKLMYSVPTTHFSDWVLPDESNVPCSQNKNVFQEPMRLIMYLPIGGPKVPHPHVYNANEKITEETVNEWPKPYMEIDWVKVYQF